MSVRTVRAFAGLALVVAALLQGPGAIALLGAAALLQARRS
jgi:hypothetical protein